MPSSNHGEYRTQTQDISGICYKREVEQASHEESPRSKDGRARSKVEANNITIEFFYCGKANTGKRWIPPAGQRRLQVGRHLPLTCQSPLDGAPIAAVDVVHRRLTIQNESYKESDSDENEEIPWKKWPTETAQSTFVMPLCDQMKHLKCSSLVGGPQIHAKHESVPPRVGMGTSKNIKYLSDRNRTSDRWMSCATTVHRSTNWDTERLYPRWGSNSRPWVY